jgi:hypothetical protein
MTETTTIQLDIGIRDILQSFGRKGETYNEIIKKLIKKARYADFMDEQYDILKNEKNWASLDDL